MKHAYLILAHNQFEILEQLLVLIDDPRNDIFIHIDKKVVDLPVLQTELANLWILEDRIDVRWGDVSVVEAELLLFQQAYQHGPYGHYHLLSGVDLPLHGQDYIHAFCQVNSGKQFIGYSSGDQSLHIERKVQRWHLFPRHFRSSGSLADNLRRAIRFIGMRVQLVFGIRRNRAIQFKKGTQWVSLTHDFVAFMLQHTQRLLDTYRYTFCADEIFVQTLCWNSNFRDSIYNLADEAEGSQRLIRWKDNRLYDWGDQDFGLLHGSALLFARKFNTQHMKVVAQIVSTITTANGKAT
ncbi:beta-1,6-N-acetylglucosaminyltransferase [Sphingobacterium griseoflavum]|uniref:Peptide O-xylosyltransferase n=1 Tax=Sphingobacterium griseoflavum TaxID=1474952 RepID=A0ABQ3HW76_9SPHI|nr:beta-1,6-N-acetylglucosaminyltransferase [Sphingobacterium griseoflavum]GHE39780.1 glycosyl transferase [Sphingobacterium griseoflavum]